MIAYPCTQSAWQVLMRKAGGEPQARSSTCIIFVPNKVTRHGAQCACPNRVHLISKRRVTLMQQGRKYSCCKCGSPITVL